ncbi:hypothetical protein G9A89_002616 [Geosiphon pyriformis]|nr:hypothetical protein G9A89_002616 [Geosiphon pyriformis]
MLIGDEVSELSLNYKLKSLFISETNFKISSLECLEGAFIVIKESLAIFPASEYSKVANLKAADAEDSLGQFFLRCYNNRIGTSQNRGKAFKLFSKAAEAGDALAQNELGWCYRNGGTTKNEEKKAFDLFLKAAEAGNILGQINLTDCYRNGLRETKNEEKAFELCSKAAKAGHLNAQYNLAFFIEMD